MEDDGRHAGQLIHEYFGVNLQVLWKAVREDIPPLKSSLVSVLRELDKAP